MNEKSNVVPMAKSGGQTPSVEMTEAERAALSDKDLAKAILARELRPRVAEMRRIADAYLSQLEPVEVKKKAKPKKEKKAGKLAKKKAKKKS